MVLHPLESSITFNQRRLCSAAWHVFLLLGPLIHANQIPALDWLHITDVLLWPLSRGHSCHLAATLHHLNPAGGKPSTCSKHVTRLPYPAFPPAEQPLCKAPPVAMLPHARLHANERRPFTEHRHQGVKWAPLTAANGWATAALTPARRPLLLIPLLITILYLLLIFSLQISFLFSFIISPDFTPIFTSYYSCFHSRFQF